jgi:putative transposase
MPRKRAPSFIHELPLRTSPADERACAIMLDAARNIANAVLGEGLRRLDLMRESKRAAHSLLLQQQLRQ